MFPLAISFPLDATFLGDYNKTLLAVLLGFSPRTAMLTLGTVYTKIARKRPLEIWNELSPKLTGRYDEKDSKEHIVCLFFMFTSFHLYFIGAYACVCVCVCVSPPSTVYRYH